MEKSAAPSPPLSPTATNQKGSVYEKDRFLQGQARVHRLVSEEVSGEVSDEQLARFQMAKVTLKDAKQSLKNINLDPDASYMGAIDAMSQRAIKAMSKDPVPQRLRPDDQIWKMSDKCKIIAESYRKLLAPALAGYENALEQAQKIPQGIKIDGITISEFIDDVKKEQSALRAVPEQVVEILENFALARFFNSIFTRKVELLTLLTKFNQHSAGKIKVDKKTIDAYLELEKFNSCIGDAKTWEAAVIQNYERILPSYRALDSLHIVPAPNGIKVAVVDLEIQLETLKQIQSISLQLLLIQIFSFQREEINDITMAGGEQLSSEVKNFYKNRITNKRNPEIYEEKIKRLIGELDAYGKEHSILIKRIKSTLYKMESLLEMEQKSGNSGLAIYKQNVTDGIKILSYADRRAALASKNKLLLLMEHVDKDKQEIFHELMESADQLEIISRNCFEDAVVLGGSKEISTVPDNLLHKVLSLLTDNYQGLYDSISRAAVDMEKMAMTKEEEEVAITLSAFAAAISDIKEWLDMHLTYFHVLAEKEQYTDFEAREYIHKLFTPEKELLKEKEEVANRNAAALLAELDLEKPKHPASSVAKGKKAKGKTSASKQKAVRGEASTTNLDTRRGASISATASAALKNDLTEWNEREGEVTPVKINEAVKATQEKTNPLDINSPLTDLMITIGKMVGAAERIGNQQVLQAESNKWQKKAEDKKKTLCYLEEQDLGLRLEKAKTLFLEYPSGKLFAFLRAHKGITKIVPRGYADLKNLKDLKVRRHPCFYKDLNGNPWLDSTGNPIYDWIEPYKIYTGKNKYAVLHAHINPKNDSECTALHFKRREQELLGKQYEIRQAEAGNDERIYRKKADKTILEIVRTWSP